MGKLKLYREPRYADKIRSYNVVVDGNVVGKIKERETFEYSLQNAVHEIWLTIDWARSNKMVCDGSKDIDLICRSNVNPFFALLSLLKPRSWIDLRKA